MIEQPKPPKGLSAGARRIWRELVGEFAIEDAAGLRILADGLRAWDRAEQLATEIGDKLSVEDRFGQVKPNPLLSLERDFRDQWLRALKQLNLDIEPVRPGPGRPGGR